MGHGHSFKFEEANILPRRYNCVSRELLESRFAGPQSINERSDLEFPYCVLRPCLSRRISHVGRVGSSKNSDESEHNGRAITKPASNTDMEITAFNKSNAECQAITASIRTQTVAIGVDNYSTYADVRYEV
ncbi:unnamed protein product [Dibothriocephalus latus]|uniref:Uncharacterized protein n=1 Tax=Dibothriocephalus latus TaxID=60516 RepID=A0A3P6U068_DIBLA|nr:unnamed protein product [Dibothriocephalus latus]